MMRVGYFGPWYGGQPSAWVAFQYGAEIEAAHGTDYRIIAAWEDRLGIDMTRNAACEWARQGRFHYLYFQDADVWSDRAVIPQMVEVAEETRASVVALAVPLRRGERRINVFPWKPGKVYEADKAGSGILLVRIAELDRIAASHDGPWFKRTYADERRTVVAETGDVAFCKLVRRHQGRLFVDARISTYHAGTQVLTYHAPNAGGQTAEGDTDSP